MKLRACGGLATWRGRALSGLLVCLAGYVLVPAAPVQARRETTFAYQYSRVWTAAVRLMRVDFECSITEKDKDDGYFLFEYPDRGKRYPGSVELIATRGDDAASVRVVIQIPGMPTYVESMMMDRLTRKLEQEFGPPKEAKPGEPAEPSKPEPEKPGNGDKAKPDNPPKKQAPGQP